MIPAVICSEKGPAAENAAGLFLYGVCGQDHRLVLRIRSSLLSFTCSARKCMPMPAAIKTIPVPIVSPLKRRITPMYRIIAPNALMSVASFEQPYFFQKRILPPFITVWL